MSDEVLHDRRIALEEAFFAKQNEALRQWLKRVDEARSKKAALSVAAGISDDVVLERLVTLEIGSDTLAALSLVPLVTIAWADGSIDDKERRTLFARVAEMGMDKQHVSYQLFERWLAERPSSALFATWKDYTSALSTTLNQEARQTLKHELLGRARVIAEATGGFLGIGRKISSAEANVLKEIEMAFGAEVG